ncbi:TIGR01777 family protein [Luteimonas yindakuii]|uniref:TIGR01777 family oxidoreductase n=1 Tax=Luteimonas yindakuii TaxID=2565782 RepID=UPI001107669F|nr:TIGR01777 family oxidoreductase [Luteimonas yindakuii]QCU72713.1 TIGR01777 family protein [Luteimonas yindakuii]
MRILITGGSGFLGRALSGALLGQGAAPTWLSRDPRAVVAPGGVDVRGYDGLHASDCFDVVVNLAGAGIADGRWSDARKQVLFDSRLEPTRSVVDWIRRARTRPRLLLSGSAVGWYGRQPADRELVEDSAAHPEFVHALCAHWERAALEAVTLDVPVVLLRTGVVLDPAGGMLRRLLPVFRLGAGGRLGSGEQVLSWISREDWVRAVLELLDQQTGRPALAGPVNLTAPAPVSNREFTRVLAGAVHRPAWATVPAGVLRLALGEMSTLLLDGQRVLPRRLLDTGFEFRHPRLDALLRPGFARQQA